jgi:anti-sigma regulatory factor (Ser/Thr protein kinase)
MIDCTDAPNRSVLVLRNDAGESARMTDWILGVCKSAGIATKTAYALQLCLEEAVSNIVEHGRGAAPATEIVASVMREHSGVVLTVEDDGTAFDPTQFAAPRRGETLEELPVGGLGIPLMRRFADSVDYLREGGRNHLRLTFAGGD